MSTIGVKNSVFAKTLTVFYSLLLKTAHCLLLTFKLLHQILRRYFNDL